MPAPSRTALALALAAVATPAAAQPWSGEVTAGYLANSGNSSNRTTNGKAELVYATEAWRNTFTGTAMQSSQDGVVNAERYFAGDKLDFNLTERDFAFVSVEFEKDLFGPVRERLSEAAGYGRKLLTGPAHVLEAEIGAGARQTEAQVTGEREREAIGRARVAYRWAFSEASRFSETVKAESGRSNTFVESVSELKLSIVGNLFATASYTVRHNTDVPPGTERTDTTTAVSLSWNFGREKGA